MKGRADCTVEGQAGRSEAPCEEESALPVFQIKKQILRFCQDDSIEGDG
jgi:hypothetical protein